MVFVFSFVVFTFFRLALIHFSIEHVLSSDASLIGCVDTRWKKPPHGRYQTGQFLLVDWKKAKEKKMASEFFLEVSHLHSLRPARFTRCLFVFQSDERSREIVPLAIEATPSRMRCFCGTKPDVRWSQRTRRDERTREEKDVVVAKKNKRSRVFLFFGFSVV